MSPNRSPIKEDLSLGQIEFTHLISLCTYFLQKLGVEVQESKIGTNMGQRYKVATPIIEKMKQKGVALDISLLLNPTTSDVRNLLLSMLGKSEYIDV